MYAICIKFTLWRLLTMAKYSKQDILNIAKKQNVQYVRLQFSDILGKNKAVEIPVAKLKDALDDKISFDGSSVEGFARIKEADMYLSPDRNTWLILDFEDLKYGKVARLICDVYQTNGKPYPGDPRYILKKTLRKMREMGYASLNVGFEPEFYLFKMDEEGKPILDQMIDKASYFDLSPMDGAEYVRRDIALALEHLGFEVQTNHHEVGPGQNEINFKYDDALITADRIQTLKQVVKIIAGKHGYYATFMPKPIEGLPGSGMHANMSLVDLEGNNVFYDENSKDGLSLACKKWISGILNHARGLAFITNPVINSYKRLVAGFEAPIYATWSQANRSSMIRIPAQRGNATRTEIRNVDCMANPYLAIACLLNAGLDGIKNLNDDEIIPSISENLFELTLEEVMKMGIKRIPSNLYDAMKEFRKDILLKHTLGDQVFDKLLYIKEKVWKEYSIIVTQFELKRYL